MSISTINTPFDHIDADTAEVTTTGGTFAAVFTNLALTTGRGLLVQNRGTANVLLGKTAAAARYRLLPGAAVSIYPKDLAKIALKADSGTQTVDVLYVS